MAAQTLLFKIPIFTVFTRRQAADPAEGGTEAALGGKSAVKADFFNGIGRAFEIKFSNVNAA